MTRHICVIASLLVLASTPSWGQKQNLSYRPIAAEYSSALDRIVMAAGGPNALYLYDPVNNISDTISLPAAPMALSISPDGLSAAVLHSASVSLVNLSAKSITKSFVLPSSVSSAQSVVLARDWIYLPATASINIASGTLTGTLSPSYYTAPARLSPDGNSIYVGGPQKFDVSKGALSTSNYLNGAASGVWFSKDGTKLYNAGGAYNVSSNTNASAAFADLAYYSVFAEVVQMRGVAESSGKGIAVLDDTTNGYYSSASIGTPIRLYDTNLTQAGILTLPSVSVGAKPYQNYGRWVFFSNAGTALFVVMQADSASGLLSDFAIQTYNLTSPPPCVATFASSTVTGLAGGGEMGSVAVTAVADCIFQATSSDPSWLNLVSGGYGSGNSTLTFVARPNGGAARSATIAIGGQKLTVSQNAKPSLGAVNRLSVNVAGAEYNKAKDKIVYISTLPNELHVYDPASGSDTVTPLAKKPFALSVSPDGSSVAVAQEGFVVVINMNTSAIATYKVPIAAQSIVLAGNGYLYLFPGSNNSYSMYSYQLSTATLSPTPYSSYSYNGFAARLHQSGNSVYVGGSYGISKFAIDGGVAKATTASNNPGACGNIWLTQTGKRVLTACGTVYRSSDVVSEDLQANGSLAGAAGGVVWADHSSDQSAIAAIPAIGYYSSVNEVQIYGDADLSIQARENLPMVDVSGTLYTGAGKYIFWRSTGAQLYAIQQVDSTANLVSNFAVASVSAVNCTFTLAPSSVNLAYDGTLSGQVSVTTNSLCRWTPITSSTWLTLNANSGGSTGSGVLSYTAAPNPAKTSRSVTIAIEGQVVTVTQDGNPGTLTVSPSVVNLTAAYVSGTITVTATNQYLGWSPSTSSTSNWVNFFSYGSSGSGSASYSASQNTGPARSMTFKILDQTITFNQAAAPGAASYTGSLDVVGCATISGWAADSARLNQVITVSIYDGTTLLSTINADQSRVDVGKYLGDNGLHGFTYSLPASLRDGKGHTIHVTFENTSTSELYGSPTALTCTSAYTGSVDRADCNGIVGWVADKSRPNTPIVVSLWDGAVLLASATANLPRQDVGAFLGDNGLHGFSIALPPSYANAASHALQLHYETGGTVVGSTFNLTCNPSAVRYAGYTDSASCSGIAGWAADKARLNTSLVVSLWDGATQIASTTASALRADVGSVLGDNGLHGFSLPLPASYANGVTHTVYVRYEESSTSLPGSAVTLTCGSVTPAVQYAGYVDKASCSGITGWAADKSRLSIPILVTLWDGSTQVASVTANASRGDVGAVLGDNGLHGFSIPIPSSIANGAAHTLQVRYETSTAQLPGSPTTLTCGGTTPGAPDYTGWVDTLSCSTISGWAADRNALNTIVPLSLYDGATLLYSLSASTTRADVGAVLGDNGAHGFSIATPISLKDGKPHTITLLPGNSTTPLPGAAKSLTCQ